LQGDLTEMQVTGGSHVGLVGDMQARVDKMSRMIRKIVIRWMCRGTVWGALRWGFNQWRNQTARDMKEEVRRGRLVTDEERDRDRKEKEEMIK
jgi:hypothetical protein